MKQKLLLFTLLIILSESTIFAQDKYTWSQFFNETVDFVKQPVKWRGYDYLRIGTVLAGTGLIMFADEPIREIVVRDGKLELNDEGKLVLKPLSQKYYSSPLIEGGRMYGELYSPVVFFVGFAAYSLITDDLWSRKVAYEIGQASLYAGGLTFILKYAVGRSRPNMNEGPVSYHPFNSFLNQEYHSLPGGHNAAAFAISTVLSRNVKPVWLKVLFYAPAAFTYASRVYQDFHWTSDDFIGAALGFYVATWVCDQHEKALIPDTTQQGMLDRIQFQPMVVGDFYGINASIRLY